MECGDQRSAREAKVGRPIRSGLGRGAPRGRRENGRDRIGAGVRRASSQTPQQRGFEGSSVTRRLRVGAPRERKVPIPSRSAARRIPDRKIPPSSRCPAVRRHERSAPARLGGGLARAPDLGRARSPLRAAHARKRAGLGFRPSGLEGSPALKRCGEGPHCCTPFSCATPKPCVLHIRRSVVGHLVHPSPCPSRRPVLAISCPARFGRLRLTALGSSTRIKSSGYGSTFASSSPTRFRRNTGGFFSSKGLDSPFGHAARQPDEGRNCFYAVHKEPPSSAADQFMSSALWSSCARGPGRHNKWRT